MDTTRWPGPCKVSRLNHLQPTRLQGKWSAAEIIHHLADSETTSGLRFRRLLVEDHPLIQGYDQDVYANSLYYNRRDIAPSLEAFRSARATTAQLFEFMTDDGLAQRRHAFRKWVLQC